MESSDADRLGSAMTWTLRLCFWHPWRMRRRWLYHPREFVAYIRHERERDRWAREHGHPYLQVPDWALPEPQPEGWWTLYRCLQKDCDGLFYTGEHAPLCTPDEAKRWGLDLPPGWSWCPECGCGSGSGVANSKVQIDMPPPSPALRAAMDQSDAKSREESRWLKDGDRKILGVF